MSVVAYARIARQELKETLESVESAMLSGGIKDFIEYQHIAGKRQGLLQALAILDETSKRFDQQD